MAIYELEQRIFYDAAVMADVAAADSSQDAESNDADDTQDNNNNSDHNNQDQDQPQPQNNDTQNDNDSPADDNSDNDDNDNITASDTDKINADDESSLDQFGDNVIIDGDTAVVSSSGKEDGAGAVYIFTKDGDNWVLVQKLTASDANAGDHFGSSIALDDDVLVIGAEGDDDMGTDSGSVYVFTKEDGAFTEQVKIHAETDGAAGDHFGWDVDIDGSKIVVGAYGDDDLGDNSGSAYVFKYDGDNWREDAKILAGDGSAGAEFGWDVAIDGDNIVVGAIGDNETGAAYVYNLSGSVWMEQAKLIAADGQAGDMFGWDVDIHDDTIAIGAIGENEHGENSGAVYVYHQESYLWNQEAKISASDGQAGDLFGYDVSLDNDHLAIGAAGSNNEQGAVYVFNHNDSGWSEYTKITSEHGEHGDHFGTSVDLDGDNLIIGMPGDDDYGQDSGSAYILTHNKPQPSPDDPSHPDGEDITNINDGTDMGNGTDQDNDNDYSPQGDTDGNNGEDGQNNSPYGDNGGNGGNGDGVFDFGNIDPPQNSTELVSAEIGQVDFFDPENMNTAYQIPNGEYGTNIETQVTEDIFEQDSEGLFDEIVNAEGADSPQETEGIDHALAQVEAEAIQNAHEIVAGFTGDNDGGSPNVETDGNHADEHSVEGHSSNEDVDRAIDRLFLMDTGINLDDEMEDLGLGAGDAPNTGQHPSFQDALDKSLDFLLK